MHTGNIDIYVDILGEWQLLPQSHRIKNNDHQNKVYEIKLSASTCNYLLFLYNRLYDMYEGTQSGLSHANFNTIFKIT